jgi:hypothetical protein
MTNTFAHNLIKERIAETIFELMFRETKQFIVFHNGFEYTEEYLAQYRHNPEVKGEIGGAPDFLLVKTVTEESAYLVEVKYRRHVDAEELVIIAESIVKRWDHAYLFLITNRDFYFGPGEYHHQRAWQD